jgi:hypothetical protein
MSRLNKAMTSAASTTELWTKAATAGAGAIIAMEAAAVALGKSWMDAGVQVSELASALGTTTEEASVLAEVAEDLNIPMSSLEMGFKKMAKEGIDPSIEGLIEVRRRLDEAKSPADRLALAQKLLGRSGADLLPMYDQLTNEELRAYIESMKESQVWTQANADRAIELRDTLKDTADNYEAAKLTLGGYLVNLTDAKDRLERLNNVLNGSITYWEALNGIVREAGDGHMEVSFKSKYAGAAINGVTQSLLNEAWQAKQAADETRKLNDFLDYCAQMHINPTIDLWVSYHYSGASGMMGVAGGQFGTGTGAETATLGGDMIRGWQMFPWSTPEDRLYAASHPKTGHALGGEVGTGGNAYMVGEHGAERFTPKVPGTISPSRDQLASSIDRMVKTLPTILIDAIERAR